MLMAACRVKSRVALNWIARGCRKTTCNLILPVWLWRQRDSQGNYSSHDAKAIPITKLRKAVSFEIAGFDADLRESVATRKSVDAPIEK